MARTHLSRVLAATAPLVLGAGAAHGQITFTIDNHAPTIATADAWSGVPITEGDILTPSTGPPFGPHPATLGAPLPVGLTVSGGFGPPGPGLGLAAHAGCIGHPPGAPCPIEVDALSYGLDYALPMVPLPAGGTLWFSVDEYAAGLAVPAAPNVFSEGSAGPEFEGAADVFTDLGLPAPGPWGVGAIPAGAVGAIDGNGLANTSGIAYPGLGLLEPSAPVAIPPDLGDNLDGVDVDTPAGGSFPVYYSLDSGIPDPLTGLPRTASGPVHGVSPADVVMSPVPGVGPLVFAPAALLGLDFFGFGTDDLDALILAENGTGVYEPSVVPYDWFPGPADMLLFSVKRGSMVIGMPDSISGTPIEAGDILTTPLPTVMGGISPFPGLFMAAENLGMATVRGGAGFGDELDALDAIRLPVFDCNGNFIEDAVDIVAGVSTDVNLNGIPDECELIATPYCFCPSPMDVCGNVDAAAGCANSTSVGALLSATGTSSVGNDDMTLTCTQGPINKSGLFFMGPGMAINVPFGDGRRCVGGMTARFNPPLNSGAAGTWSLGSIVGYSIANFPPAQQIVAFSTWNFQLWYRDPMGPCAMGFNLSNGLSVTFTP